jgi:hypothetical protein
VGTSNINIQSLAGNYELDVVIEDRVLATAMEHQFRRDIAASAEVVRQPRHIPKALQKVVPTRLERRHSEIALETVLRSPRGRRDFQARAMIAARRLASGAFRSLLGPVTLALLILGALFLGLPRVMATLFGGICLALAVVLGIQVWRRREM